MHNVRSALVGPQARVVAIPKNFFANLAVERPSGKIILPLHVWWSEPSRVFDLSVAEDLRRAYGLILAEGTEADVRQFIDPSLLMEIWDDLLLPIYVRDAWEKALRTWGQVPA